MKRLIVLSLVLMAALTMNAQRTRTVYYVVLASYSSLNEAKTFNSKCPDGLESNIYYAKANGRTVYRACVYATYTKSNAHECAREINKNYGYNAWVWASKGIAKCAHQGIALSGDPISTRPEQ